MESDDPKKMKLLAKKIEEAARDSAIKVVEEAEEDTNRFRKWQQIGFFDRCTHFRGIQQLYTWVIDHDSLKIAENEITFDMNREYTSEFAEIAKEKLNDCLVQLQVTLTVTCTGIFNLLVEDKQNKRFRVRDVPGVLSEDVFKKPCLGGISDLNIITSEDKIEIGYKHESKAIHGYQKKDTIQHNANYLVILSTKGFNLEYKVNGKTKLLLNSNSFIFETKADIAVIEILLDDATSEGNETNIETYQRLLTSTKESYKFKKYIEEIPHGPASVGTTFEFVNDPSSNFDLKLMGI